MENEAEVAKECRKIWPGLLIIVCYIPSTLKENTM